MNKFSAIFFKIKKFFYKFSPEVRKVKKWRDNFKKELEIKGEIDKRTNEILKYGGVINIVNDLEPHESTTENLIRIREFCENFLIEIKSDVFCRGLVSNYSFYKKNADDVNFYFVASKVLFTLRQR